MSVNSIHPVNMVPVQSRGSAPAKKAGEASFVTKVTCLLKLLLEAAKGKTETE